MELRGFASLSLIFLVVLAGCAGAQNSTNTPTEVETTLTPAQSDTATDSRSPTDTATATRTDSATRPDTATATRTESATRSPTSQVSFSVTPQFTSSGDFSLSIIANTSFEQTDDEGDNPGEPYFIIEINGDEARTTDQVERAQNGEFEVRISETELAEYTGNELDLTVRLMDEDSIFDDEINTWETSIPRPTPTADRTETQTLRSETSTSPERDTATATLSPTPTTTLTPSSTATPIPSPTATATPPPTPVPTPTPTATPTPSLTPTPTATPTPSPSPTPTQTTTPDQPSVVVEVTGVTDGDTIDILFQNGTEDTVRLLGVDTPETYGSTTPGEFEGVPDSEAGRDCLRDQGQEATAYMMDRLAGESVRLVFDSQSDRRGSFNRLLAYVVADGENVNYQLVSEGYARVYDSTFEQSDRFYAAENDAQSSERGVWVCRDVVTPTPTPTSTPEPTDNQQAGELAVAQVHADAEGNDHENENDEYIVFENAGSSTLDLSGWTIADEADHTYYVPDGVELGPGETITLYTGSSSDSNTELYWGSDSAIWNNGGDTIVVSNGAGSVVLKYEYSG